MDYDQQISKINNEIIEVKTKIKKANEKRTNAIISRNNQLWKEVIKDESSIIIAISNIKLIVDKLQIENPDKKNINNILCLYINLMKHANIIRVGWSSLSWRINKIYDKNTTIVEIIILLKEIVFVLSQIIKPIFIIGEENKIQSLIEQEKQSLIEQGKQSLIEQGKQIELTLTNINNDAHELINIIETKNLNNINNITLEKIEIIEQLVKIKEDENNYISLFLTILKKNLLLINNTKLSIDKIVLFTQKIVENAKTQYIETAFHSNQESKNRNDKWITKLKEVKDFIIENNKRPSKYNNNEKRYATWINTQTTFDNTVDESLDEVQLVLQRLESNTIIDTSKPVLKEITKIKPMQRDSDIHFAEKIKKQIPPDEKIGKPVVVTPIEEPVKAIPEPAIVIETPVEQPPS